MKIKKIKIFKYFCKKIKNLKIMTYTFQISDVSPQSNSIIKMLLTLSQDYDFLKLIINNEESELSAEQEEELERRYKIFLENPKNGKSWNEVKANLLK